MGFIADVIDMFTGTSAPVTNAADDAARTEALAEMTRLPGGMSLQPQGSLVNILGADGTRLGTAYPALGKLEFVDPANGTTMELGTKATTVHLPDGGTLTAKPIGLFGSSEKMIARLPEGKTTASLNGYAAREFKPLTGSANLSSLGATFPGGNLQLRAVSGWDGIVNWSDGSFLGGRFDDAGQPRLTINNVDFDANGFRRSVYENRIDWTTLFQKR